MNRSRSVVMVVFLAVLLSGCTAVVPTGGSATPASLPDVAATPPATAAEAGGTLTVMTHDSFSVSESVVAAFEEQCACQVTFLQSGDAGLALNRAILSRDNPLADVFFGVDNSFMGRALAADIFEPYASPQLEQIPDELELDPQHRLVPVDFGYVTLNYDKEYFEAHNVPVPQALRDLTRPEYSGLLVVENPASSSPGLSFLATTVAVFGESGEYTYLDFWRDLRANDVLVAEGWEDAYYGQFSGGSGEGDRPLVVSYATSPAAEVFFADPPPAESPTGNIVTPGESFRQIEFAGILRGTQNPELARRWIDFMLGDTFQADIPLQMFVYPARDGVPLPDVFTQFAPIPGEPAQVTPEQIDSNRDAWLQAWTDVVLR